MKHCLHSQRGSALLVALIFSIALAASVGSYLSLTLTSLKASNRSYHATAAMNVAETGLEEAMWSINEMVNGNLNAFANWSIDGSKARRTLTGFNFGQNRDSSLRMLINNYTGATGTPVVVARSNLTLGDGSRVEKWIEVTLNKRSMFASGLVAKENILFKGNNPTVDSWNSDPDNNPATPALSYSSARRNDEGSVGSISVAVDVVSIQQADIWGYVSTGRYDPTATVGRNGSILGSDSPAGIKVDANRVSTDFKASFDPVETPSTNINLAGIGTTTDLPNAGDASADGKCYYSASGIGLNNAQLNITSGHVIIVIAPGGGIDIGGNSGAINVANGATLEIYVAGNVRIAGQGVTNGTPVVPGSALGISEIQQPIRFRLWGTAPDSDNNSSTTHQSIDVKGNGVFSGVVYAPNAQVFINGNGHVCGSVVANKITLVGNATFHYDESLKNFSDGNPFGIAKWRELVSSAERASYAGDL